MATTSHFELETALQVARDVRYALKPFCERIEIAGSVRRRKPTVKDVEFVVQPRNRTDMFGYPGGGPNVGRIAEELASICNHAVKGRMRQLKSVWNNEHPRRALPLGIPVEIYCTHPPAQWGSTLAIRTGPADYMKWCMARLLKRGLRHIAGHVETQDTGTLVPTPEEADFFRLCGVEHVAPEHRAL